MWHRLLSMLLIMHSLPVSTSAAYPEQTQRTNSDPETEAPKIVHLFWIGTPLPNIGVMGEDPENDLRYIDCLNLWCDIYDDCEIILWYSADILTESENSAILNASARPNFYPHDLCELGRFAERDNHLVSVGDDHLVCGAVNEMVAAAKGVKQAIEQNHVRETNYGKIKEGFMALCVYVLGGLYADIDAIPRAKIDDLPLKYGVRWHLKKYGSLEITSKEYNVFRYAASFDLIDFLMARKHSEALRWILVKNSEKMVGIHPGYELRKYFEEHYLKPPDTEIFDRPKEPGDSIYSWIFGVGIHTCNEKTKAWMRSIFEVSGEEKIDLADNKHKHFVDIGVSKERQQLYADLELPPEKYIAFQRVWTSTYKNPFIINGDAVRRTQEEQVQPNPVMRPSLPLQSLQ